MNIDEARTHAQRLGSTVYIGTVTASAFANITPIVMAWPDERIYMATGAKSFKVRDLAKNPNVTLHWPVSQATNFDQLKIRGKAEVLTDPASRARLWKAFDYDLAAFFGTPDSAELCYIALTPERIVMELAMGAGGRETWKA